MGKQMDYEIDFKSRLDVFDMNAPMNAGSIGELTAAENVLAYLIVEFCHGDDQSEWTPQQAQRAIAAQLRDYRYEYFDKSIEHRSPERDT